MSYECVVIGVSSGGVQALPVVLIDLPGDLAAPVVVVQHWAPGAGAYLAQSLNHYCTVTVTHAQDEQLLLAGWAYLAPAKQHPLVGSGQTLSLSVDAGAHGGQSAVDVLFETAAEVFGAGLIGVILTGAGQAGSEGLARVHECGGVTIVQDPSDAACPDMPRAALEATPVAHVLPLDRIGPALASLCGGGPLETIWGEALCPKQIA